MIGADDRFVRYAIFWLPPADSEIAEFGRQWFGICPEAGEADTHARFDLPWDLAAEALSAPRRYALHGTIVAPFRPTEPVDSGVIAEELRRFCARRAARRTGPLRLKRLNQFLVLIPDGRTAALDWLAADCVTTFNRFRAPTTPDDMMRYPPDRHSSRQRAHVRQFGYPYVLSDFLFHITLAGPLTSAAQLDQVEGALAPSLEGITGAPLTVDCLCLLGDPGEAAPFRLVARCPLVA